MLIKNKKMKRLSRKELTEKVSGLETEVSQLKSNMFSLLELNYKNKYYKCIKRNSFDGEFHTYFMHVIKIEKNMPISNNIDIIYHSIHPEKITKCFYSENTYYFNLYDLNRAEKISKKKYDEMLKIALEYKHDIKF